MITRVANSSWLVFSSLFESNFGSKWFKQIHIAKKARVCPKMCHKQWVATDCPSSKRPIWPNGFSQGSSFQVACKWLVSTTSGLGQRGLGGWAYAVTHFICSSLTVYRFWKCLWEWEEEERAEQRGLITIMCVIFNEPRQDSGPYDTSSPSLTVGVECQPHFKGKMMLYLLHRYNLNMC